MTLIHRGYNLLFLLEQMFVDVGDGMTFLMKRLALQSLQHKMVDMFMEAEVSKSLLFKAMLQLDGKDDEASKTISGLKAQIGKSSRQVGQAAVQLHGGMGVSDEMSIGHYLKRFTVIDALFGNRNYHLNNFSNL